MSVYQLLEQPPPRGKVLGSGASGNLASASCHSDLLKNLRNGKHNPCIALIRKKNKYVYIYIHLYVCFFRFLLGGGGALKQIVGQDLNSDCLSSGARDLRV